MTTAPDETRAEVARRRLAELAASFESRLPAPEDAPAQHRAAADRRLSSAHVRVVVALAVAAVVIVGWWLLADRPEDGSGRQLAFPASASPSAAAELIIDVTGKVRRPGIVTLPAGSRVHDAIEAAGGLRGKVDTSSLNLARKLADGEQVIVGLQPAPAAAGPAGGPAGGQLNLNTATSEQLEELPGIGPVTAGAIIAWRDENGPFTSVEDLLDVTGIGEATLDELRDHVRV